MSLPPSTAFNNFSSHLPIRSHDNVSELLSHFIKTGSEWVGSPECQRLMQKHANQLVLKASYIQHAILAFSASHIAYLHASEKRYTAKKYTFAASFHYQRSLQQYNSHLGTSWNVADINEIIGCSHLLTMLAFASLHLGNGSDGFTWLRAMRGVPTLWSTNNLGAHLKKSIWHTVCDESHEGLYGMSCSHTEFSGEDFPGSKICVALNKLCAAQGNLSTFQNAYEGPLHSLCQLMTLDNNRDKIGRYIYFIGSLPEAFLLLLDKNDPIALLIICYWCAFFSQINQWWITRSALVECERLCRYLGELPDPQIDPLLQYPAGKCGFVLTRYNNDRQ